MKDYTDFLNAPDEPAVKDNSEFLNAPDTYTETKGNKFRQVKPVEPSSIAKLFLKYAPEWMQETATKSATGGYLPEVLDVAGGATGVARGGLNMVSPGMGERTFPTKGFTTGTDVDPTSGAYLGGQFIDPVAQALGMGAGRVVQAVPAVSKAYKSAEAVRAANATRTAGTAAKNVPMNVEQALRYGASGAAAGAGTGYLSSEGDLTAAGEGGLLGFGLGTGLYGLGKGLQLGAGHLGDFITGKSGKVNAGKIFRKVEELTPGSNLRTQLANAGPDLTAAQAAYGVNNNPFQALGVAAAENDKTSFYTALKAKQAAAREGMLSGATPDLATAEAARQASKSQMYPAAFAADDARQTAATIGPVKPEFVVTNPSTGGGYYKPFTPLTPQLPVPIQALASEPIMIAAAKDAAEAIRIDPNIAAGVRSQIADNPMQSVQGLHNMKAAIDAQIRNPNPESALGKYKETSLKIIQRQLVKALEQVSPEYNAARVDFATKSQPINQSQTLEILRQRLVNPTNPAEQRTGPFLAALDRGEESVLRAAGLNTRFNDNLQSVLTPRQFQTVGNIASELTRDAAMKSQAAAGAKPLAGIVGDTLAKNMTLPGYIDPKVTAYNKFISFMTGKVAQKTVDAISEGMKSGKSALEVLNTLPLAERNRGLMALGQLGKISPELAGIAGGMQSNKNGNQ